MTANNASRLGRHWRESRSRLTAFLQQGVVRSITVLVGGTVTAHSITALAMPISTRLFTPTDFSIAAAFSSMVGIFSAAACLRFDMAIPLPERDEEAADLLVLSILMALAMAILVGFVLVLLPDSIFALLKQPELKRWLWLLPVGVLIGGTYLALQMWFVRRRDFPSIARSRIAQSAAAAAGQLSLGAAGYAPLGLIIGQLLNYGAGSVWLTCSAIIRDRAMLSGVSVRGMARAFSTYRRFPLYSTWEALANAASNQAPMFIIAALAAGPEAGYLTLAIFLLQMPMALIGNAIGQLFVSRAPEEYREGRLADYTCMTITNLARVAGGPIALIAVISPGIFGLVFGQSWHRAGVLAAWMAPWFFAQLLAVPVSSALHIVGRQRVAMLLQLGGLLFRICAVLLAIYVFEKGVSEVYALSGFLFYVIYLYVVCRSAGMRIAQTASAVCRALPFALIGGLLACLALLIASRVLHVLP